MDNYYVMRARTVLLVGLLLGVFCPSAAIAEGDECPDLVGTWDFVSVEVESESGNYTVVADAESAEDIAHTGETFHPEERLVIETQNGCFFEGYNVYMLENETITDGVSGAVGRDGKTIYWITHSAGFGFGELVSPTEMTLYWMSHVNAITGEDDSHIAIMDLVKEPDETMDMS
jgi:hypothetical protein